MTADRTHATNPGLALLWSRAGGRSGREAHMSKFSLAVLGVLVLSSSAWAQKAKYTRSQDLKVDVKLSDRVKPIQAKDAKEEPPQPSLSADQVLSIEGLVGDIRSEQEDILAKLIIKTPDS